MEHLGCRAAPTGPWMHRLCIIASWLLLQISCEASTCQNSIGKSVGKAVEASQVYDNGPMDPPSSNHGHCSNYLNGRLSLALEQLSWIGDMAWPLGGPSSALVGPSDTAKCAQGSLPHPLAFMYPYLSHFCLFLLKFPAYK